MYAIEVRTVSKKYRIYHDRSTTLKEKLLFFNRTKYEEHQVLNNIDLKIEPGTTIGLIGQNGSGKSTLLKLLTRIIYPDSGEIIINGKVSSLLELGSGFHPDFSGRENIYNYASIFGLSREEIDKRFDQIVEFSELGEYIDNPIRTYSSGMYMRLAFSVAINVDADILLIDEILAVGDAAFQKKCFDKILALKKQGKTIVIVTHDTVSVTKICDLAVWLDGGKIKKSGFPVKIVESYLMYMSDRANCKKTELIESKELNATNIETGGKLNGLSHNLNKGYEVKLAELLDLKILNEKGESVLYITSESTVKIEYSVKMYSVIPEPHYGIIIKDCYGNSVFETNTYCMGIITQSVEDGQVVKVSYTFKCNLASGIYSIAVGIANEGSGRGVFKDTVLLKYGAGDLKVVENDNSIIFGGYYNLNPRVEID